MSQFVKAISDGTFDEEVLKASLPVVVDFWAEWCGPCKALSPIFEEIAQKYADKIKCVKVNVDDNPKTPGNFGVRGIPTLILFKNGSEAGRQVGLVNKTEFMQFIDSHL